jgi:hypothetical protein
VLVAGDQLLAPALGRPPSLLRSISPAAGGATFDEAVTEMADARRDYAHDWQDHLLNAANHRENRGLPQQVVG